MASPDMGGSKHGIPDVLMQHIDRYVDSLQPQIQPLVASEIDTFQTKTINSLEDQVVNAFRSLFKRDSPQTSDSRSLSAAAPDSYGVESLPFADEIASLTRSFSKMADEANDDLQDILNLTESREAPGTQSRGLGDSFGHGAKGFLSAAIEAISEHAGHGSGGGGGGSSGQQVVLDGLLGVLSGTVRDSSRNPEEKARIISPEIKDKVAVILRQQHASIAEQFTRIALDHIKTWLRGNMSARDVGDGLKEEMSDMVTGFISILSSKKGHSDDNARGFDRGSDDQSRGISRDSDDGNRAGGFSRVISDKMSTGLAKVHREVRLEFRKVLGSIEKNLFEALPDEVQGPLEKILGGNPFDPSLDAQAQSSRGFGDDIKAKLVSKIRDLVRKVQESLRENILSVVNGGHRKLESETWLFVHGKVEEKVRRFLPDVKIRVPDDIGDEGVSVGVPQTLVPQRPDGVPQHPSWNGFHSSPTPPTQHHYPPPTVSSQHSPPSSYPNPNAQYQQHFTPHQSQAQYPAQ